VKTGRLTQGSSILYFHRKITGSIDLRKIEVDAVNQLLLARNPYAAQHCSRYLAEHGFHDVEPRSMLGREGELEAMRAKTQIRLCLF